MTTTLAALSSFAAGDHPPLPEPTMAAAREDHRARVAPHVHHRW